MKDVLGNEIKNDYGADFSIPLPPGGDFGNTGPAPNFGNTRPFINYATNMPNQPNFNFDFDFTGGGSGGSSVPPPPGGSPYPFKYPNPYANKDKWSIGDAANSTGQTGRWFMDNFGPLTPQVAQLFSDILAGGMPPQLNIFDPQVQAMLMSQDARTSGLYNTFDQFTNRFDTKANQYTDQFNTRADQYTDRFNANSDQFVNQFNSTIDQLVDPMTDYMIKTGRGVIHDQGQSDLAHAQRRLGDTLSGGSYAQGYTDLEEGQIASEAQALRDLTSQAGLEGMRLKGQAKTQAGMAGLDAKQRAGMLGIQGMQQAGLAGIQGMQQAGLAGIQGKQQGGLTGMQNNFMTLLNDLEAKRNFYNSIFGGAMNQGTNAPLQFGNLMGILATIRQNKRNSDNASGGGGLFGLF